MSDENQEKLDVIKIDYFYLGIEKCIIIKQVHIDDKTLLINSPGSQKLLYLT